MKSEAIKQKNALLRQWKPEFDNMHNPVTFITVGNKLWEMKKWEMMVGWLRGFWGFGEGNS